LDRETVYGYIERSLISGGKRHTVITSTTSGWKLRMLTHSHQSFAEDAKLWPSHGFMNNANWSVSAG